MKKNILAIDDETDITDLLQYFLQEEGHRVTVANSGNEAINYLKKIKYDVIISDFNMNDGNGMTVLEYTQTLEKQPHFFFFSAANDEVENECLKRGACGFLRKPISLNNLSFAIRSALI